eukprot:SAG22_NODE_10295_length_542_cov_9.465011_1_plen_96_part_00
MMSPESYGSTPGLVRAMAHAIVVVGVDDAPTEDDQASQGNHGNQGNLGKVDEVELKAGEIVATMGDTSESDEESGCWAGSGPYYRAIFGRGGGIL